MIDNNKKYYLLRHDKVFKNVFYRDYNLLKKFLMDILSNFYENLEINTVKLLNTELTKDRIYVKNKTVDILVEAAGKYINIEINIDSGFKTIYRNFFFLINALVEHIKKGENYTNIREHIQINFNFDGKSKEGFEVLQYGNLKTNKVSIPFLKTININIDYFKDKWYNSDRPKDFYEKYKSIIVFGLDEDEFKGLKDDDKYMEKLKNDVDTLNKDPEFYQAMTDEEDIKFQVNSSFIEGKNEGVSQGVLEGSKAKTEEIVRKMKEENISSEMIQKITGLSIEEINNI